MQAITELLVPPPVIAFSVFNATALARLYLERTIILALAMLLAFLVTLVAVLPTAFARLFQEHSATLVQPILAMTALRTTIGATLRLNAMAIITASTMGPSFTAYMEKVSNNHNTPGSLDSRVIIHRIVRALTPALQTRQHSCASITKRQFAYPQTKQRAITNGLGVPYIVIVNLIFGPLNQPPIWLTGVQRINTQLLGTQTPPIPTHPSLTPVVGEVATSFASSVSNGTWLFLVKIFGRIKTATSGGLLRPMD